MEEPRRALIDTVLAVQRAGLVRGTWGNLSVRRGDTIWITPSGVPYSELKPGDVVEVSLKTGRPIRSDSRPSTELPMHLEIYRNFSNINAVVHTHSVYASAFAAAEMVIPCYTEDQAQIIGGSVRVASYAPPGTRELAQNVVEVLKDRFAALLSHHGAVAVGRSLKEAYVAAEILEKSAQIAYILAAFPHRQAISELKEEDVLLLRKAYLESYGRKIASE